jgi:aconitate hydratase
MVNGLCVLGWGVGGIEAEAAMLGQPVSMLIPEVVGFHLSGALARASPHRPRAHRHPDAAQEGRGRPLRRILRPRRVGPVGRGPRDHRQHGARIWRHLRLLPVDGKTLDYLRLTGRSEEQIALVETYAREQGMWLEADAADPVFTDTLELDMSTVEPSLAGPKRPQDKVLLTQVDDEFRTNFTSEYGHPADELPARFPIEGEVNGAGDVVTAKAHDLGHGDVVIAAITSCTNTSNPSVLVAAGLVARKARERGLDSKPWVKTSLAPGSQVVTDYLDRAGLSEDLNAIGFDLVGYGCTTCIGNSGPLPEHVSAAIHANDLVAASVLSGNRNFEGRVSPDVRANYLASPPLVVAYAIKGTVTEDMVKSPIGKGKDGSDVYLRDIWPTNEEVRSLIDQYVNADMFATRYADVYKGDERWREIDVTGGETYAWAPTSTYIQNPPYFEGMSMTAAGLTDICRPSALAVFGDSITTDHISPAGSIKADSPAGPT